ncbi:JAB domain-containing protein [Sandaracinobacteroides saxicola]|uniref:JAB domain-containing protein n=1 Tax=Sandaracinobacteroides saxicola TaxID=2759707 RepID=A0A7G5IK25_9SPHN|nr:JAB domain-containing protein [Sandaracinobacteroides saxicola]QMW23717.1 JAB domain-containing protein [Sandaracinobacteroides saxicola]
MADISMTFERQDSFTKHYPCTAISDPLTSADAMAIELLCNAGTTGATARHLVRSLGGGARAITASHGLLAMHGATRSEIAILQRLKDLLFSVTKARIDDRPVLDNSESLIDYLRLVQGHSAREHVRVLFLDAQYRLIKNHHISDGDAHQSLICQRQILGAALQCDASSLILVHNHPSGACTFSQKDIVATRSLVLAAHVVELDVLDHILVTSDDAASMRRDMPIVFCEGAARMADAEQLALAA